MTTVSDPARAEAVRILRDQLGIGPSVLELMAAASEVLGHDRLAQCRRWIRGGALSHRSYALGSVAALVVATRALGAGWWSTPRDGHVPDEVLAAADPPPASHRARPLEPLEWWASDAVADQLWGRPHGAVDVNGWTLSDLVSLPPGARLGDRLVLSFDPGSRVDAVVVARSGGCLGSEVELESCRLAPPCEVSWAWGIANRLGPHHLDDEAPGSAADPYAAPLDTAAAEAVRDRARSAGVDPGTAWTRVGDLFEVLDEYSVLPWTRAARALADGDLDEMARALASRW
jgi:hypothetical protein